MTLVFCLAALLAAAVSSIAAAVELGEIVELEETEEIKEGDAPPPAPIRHFAEHRRFIRHVPPRVSADTTLVEAEPTHRRPVMPAATQPSPNTTQPATTQSADAATQPAAQAAPGDRQDPRVITAVKTWGELSKRPAFDLGDGTSVRLGIDTATCTADGSVMVYGLFDGLGVYEPVVRNGDAVLGPLRVAASRESHDEAAGDVVFTPEPSQELPRQFIRVAAGRHLFVALVPMQDAKLMYIDVKNADGKRLAAAEIKPNGFVRHPWLAFEGYRLGKSFRDEWMEKDYARALAAVAKKGKHITEPYDAQVYEIDARPASPVVRGETPLWSEADGKPIAASRALPSLESPREPAIKAEYADGKLKLTMPDGLMIDDVAGQVLLRWWVNGKPYLPPLPTLEEMQEHYDGESTQGMPMSGALHADPLRLAFAIDPEALGVKPGDRVGVQAIYTPFGWATMRDNAVTGNWYRTRYVGEHVPIYNQHGKATAGVYMRVERGDTHDSDDTDPSTGDTPSEAIVLEPLGHALAVSNRVDFALQDTARIPVTRTWGELLRQKPIDVGDGATVRLCIESPGVPANGRVYVYALTHFAENQPAIGKLGEPDTRPLGALTLFVGRVHDGDLVEEIEPQELHKKDRQLNIKEAPPVSGLYVAAIDLTPGESVRLQLRKSDGTIVATQRVNGLDIAGVAWMPLARARAAEAKAGEEADAPSAPPKPADGRRPPATQPSPRPAKAAPAAPPAAKREPAYAPVLNARAWPALPVKSPLVAFDPNIGDRPAWMRDDTPLPGVLSPAATPGFTLRVEGDALVVTTDPPLFLGELDSAIRNQFIISVSVRGDPFQPRVEEDGQVQMIRQQPARKGEAREKPQAKPAERVVIPLRLDAGEMALRKGDRLSVRVMFCPRGIESTLVTPESPRAMLANGVLEAVLRDSQPRVSNAVEIIVK